MPALLDCPWIEHWHLLRDVTLPAEQHDRFERHLESCPVCQERLDRTEEDEVALLTLARQLGDPTLAPTDATLEQFLERLQEPKGPGQTAPVEPPDLYFLHPSDRPDLLGILGDYEVQEVIGQGGMGVVLKAFEPALQRLVAIKVLAAAVAGSATARKRFTREAQAAASVCHDHIVTVHGVHETDGLPYLVMQYVAGESLQDRLDRDGPLEREEVVRIGLQTARGLAAAHARGLIHRDVKPANILLENGLDRVKLTDFGLARMVDDVGLTQNGVVAGTPEYMAPEQARGEPVDHRADLFSLGSVLYALCTGASPFHGPTAVAVIHKVSEQEPTPLRSLNPEVPVWLEGFIARLLAKNPADRFQTTSQVVVLLEGFLAHLGQPTALAAPELPPSLPPIPPRNSGTREPGGWWQQITRPFSLPAAGLVVACVVAALTLGISYWFAGLGEPEPRKDARELHLPLRGIPENGEGWDLIGPDANQCVRFEPEGLRITLPAGFPNDRPGTGVRIPLPARGDFEMTIHYEILTEPEKANAGQRPTKLTVQAQLDRRPWTVAGIARRVTSDKGTQFATWTIRDNDDNGNRQPKARQHAAQARVGRLRIVRTGAEASFYAAEGSDADFTLLPPPRSFGEEDLKNIEVVGSTGGPKAMLDVRFTDLRVHMSTGLASSSSEGSARRSARIAFPILVAVSPVLALGVWLLRRRGRRAQAEQQATDSDSEGDRPAEATAPLAFRCPGCARGLKARADLAGTKRKCPGCGTVVSVPRAGSAEPSKARALGAKGWLFIALGLASATLVLVLFGVWLVRPTRSSGQEHGAQQAEQSDQQARPDQQAQAAQQANKGQAAEPGPGADKERPEQKNKERFPDATAAPRQEYALNYLEPFKGQPEKPHDFALIGADAGKHVKFEAEGLRITLPIGKNHAPTGLATTFGVRGDFAITVCYQILEEPVPADAGTPASGTRISLTVNLDRPLLNEAAIRRKVTPTQPVHILTWRSLLKDTDGKPDKRGHLFPVKEKTGRFRLVRTGANVAYYLSEGAEKEFTLLTTQPFGADDLKDVQIFGQTSSTKAAFDVRITGLHIAAAALVRKPARAHLR